MDAFLELFELEFESASYGVEAELVEVVEHFAEPDSARHQRVVAGGDERGGVVGDVLFECGVFEEVGHDGFGVGSGLGLEHDRESGFAGGFVDQVGELWEFAVGDQESDIGLELIGGDPVGDRVDHDPTGRVASTLRFGPPFASNLD